jgi:peroxiredoxin
MLGAAVLAGCGPKAGGGAGVGAVAEAGELAVLGMAPEWELRRLDGTTLKSPELAGKVVVVDFWATWCPPCVEEIPGYVEMQREHEAAGLVIVGISLDQAGVEEVRKFGERYGMNYPVVMADRDVVAAFGGVEAIPTTFLIDREGRIRHRKVGMITRADYEPLVKALL